MFLTDNLLGAFTSLIEIIIIAILHNGVAVCARLVSKC